MPFVVKIALRRRRGRRCRRFIFLCGRVILQQASRHLPSHPENPQPPPRHLPAHPGKHRTFPEPPRDTPGKNIRPHQTFLDPAAPSRYPAGMQAPRTASISRIPAGVPSATPAHSLSPCPNPGWCPILNLEARKPGNRAGLAADIWRHSFLSWLHGFQIGTLPNPEPLRFRRNPLSSISC